MRCTQALEALMSGVPALDPERVWSARRPGVLAMVTGVPFPGLNGVLVFDDRADPDEVGALLRELPVDGLPYSLQSTPAMREPLARVAQQHGLVTGPDVPLMQLDTAPARPAIEGLSFRELHPDEFDQRCVVAAPGFGTSAEAMNAAANLFGRTPGYRMYLGEVDGVPVTSAVGITQGDAVGIFDVVTPAEHRGRGYGAAITAHAILEGFANGASWSWLQSSPEGFSVYERLGFTTRQVWGLWVEGH